MTDHQLKRLAQLTLSNQQLLNETLNIQRSTLQLLVRLAPKDVPTLSLLSQLEAMEARCEQVSAKGEEWKKFFGLTE